MWVAGSGWEASRKLTGPTGGSKLGSEIGVEAACEAIGPERGEICRSRTGSGTRETSLFPARLSHGRENRRGVPCPREGCSPPKWYACWSRTGSGTREASLPPPGRAMAGKIGGECHVYGRGAPRRRSVSLLAAGGEWDARIKLIPRPATGRTTKAEISHVVRLIYGRIVSKKPRPYMLAVYLEICFCFDSREGSL